MHVSRCSACGSGCRPRVSSRARRARLVSRAASSRDRRRAHVTTACVDGRDTARAKNAASGRALRPARPAWTSAAILWRATRQDSAVLPSWGATGLTDAARTRTVLFRQESALQCFAPVLRARFLFLLFLSLLSTTPRGTHAHFTVIACAAAAPGFPHRFSTALGKSSTELAGVSAARAYRHQGEERCVERLSTYEQQNWLPCGPHLDSRRVEAAPR